MQTIAVHLGDRTYEVHVGTDLLGEVGRCLSAVLQPCRVVVVCDKRVAPLYAQPLEEGLEAAGFVPTRTVIPPGEEHKTLASAQRLYDAFFDAQLDRKCAALALGGGVVGDLTGFAAATFMRGIAFVQVPTTLLAQVDASVGGKVAVNHPRGKNMIGAFHQPRAVFADIATLGTLPHDELVNGLVEVIKHGVIRDRALFDFVETHLDEILRMEESALEHIVWRSVQIKAAVVEADEREDGLRAILNYGHTVGHAIESLTNFVGYSHGAAVAVGMCCCARMAVRMGLLAEGEGQRIEELLRRLGLDTRARGLDPTKIYHQLYADKKTERGKLRFVLPTTIGNVVIRDDVPDNIIMDVLREQTSR